jgi:hypothetical protein
MTASFCILSNSLFTHNAITWCHIIRTIESVNNSRNWSLMPYSVKPSR